MALEIKLDVMKNILVSNYGMMSQVLVVTHEMASPQEYEPYLSWRLRPCRLLALRGRSATMDPPCSKWEAVYWFWKGPACKALFFFGVCVL